VASRLAGVRRFGLVDASEIQLRRKALGLSQAALADEVGVTQGAVSAWETGRTAPRHEQVEELERVLGGQPIGVPTSPSQDYGEWLRAEREDAGLSREGLAAASGVSAIGIYNIESGRSVNPRPKTRKALERALRRSAPEELVQAVEQSAEIQGVGRMSDFDPHSEDDFPREPGVYVLYDISDRPIYVGKSSNIRERIRTHVDKFWYRSPIVEKAAYVRVDDPVLRGQLEETLIKFLKSNAVINQRLVDR
jgi:transcriptional regulator with XRE-family HTH domain